MFNFLKKKVAQVEAAAEEVHDSQEVIEAYNDRPLKTYEEALREARMLKCMCGAEERIYTKNGYWFYRDSNKKINNIEEFLKTVEVEEDFVREIMGR